MLVATVFTLLVIFFYAQFSSREAKGTVGACTVIFFLTIWLLYLFMNMGEQKPVDKNPLYLLLIPCFIAVIYVIHRIKNVNNTSIVAKQINYWGIPSSLIYTNNKNRTINKPDRVETKVNKLEKNIVRKFSNTISFLNANIVLEMRNLKLTQANSVDDIKNYNLYDKVFSKIKEMISYSEHEIEYENLLKENGNYIEYFLLDLWESYTQNFNIGTANLEIYATNEIQKNFIGALDNIDLNSVKRKGAALFYSYMKFKNRV